MSKPKIIVFSFLVAIAIALLWGNYRFNIIAFNICDNNDDGDFRVLTWNVCGANIDSGEREEHIARLIIAQDADFVQLNEFCLDSCLMIDSILSKHYPYKEDVNAHKHAGDIFYSKRKMIKTEMLNTDVSSVLSIKLCLDNDSLYIVGCHLTGNNREGHIQIGDADSLSRVNTFWNYYRNAQEKRKEDTHLVKNAIIEGVLPIIVMGDMNDFNHSAPMDSLKDAGMKNAWWEGGFGYGATYHEGWLRLRIDHIYYNNKLTLKNVKVVSTELSDHNMLIADFSIKQ